MEEARSLGLFLSPLLSRWEQTTWRNTQSFRHALQTWLTAHPPLSLRDWADRCVLHAMLPPGDWRDADRAHQRTAQPGLADAVEGVLESDVLCTHLTSAMAVVWALRQTGENAPRHREVLRLACTVAGCAGAWREPFRSVFHRWSKRLPEIPGHPWADPLQEPVDSESLADMLMARTHGGLSKLRPPDSGWYDALTIGPPVARAARLCLLPLSDPRMRPAILSTFTDFDGLGAHGGAGFRDDHRAVCRALLGLARLDAVERPG